MEEAAQIAADYVYALDNLPNEVKFIMEEIRLKDVATLELQNAINRRVLRANPRIHQMSAKDANVAERIQPDLDRIDVLAKEKVVLAQKLVDLVDKHCARLDHDLNKVRVASGELPIPTEVPFAMTSRSGERASDPARVVVAPPEVAPSPPPSMGAPALKRRKFGSNTGTVNSAPILLASVPAPPRSRLVGTAVRPSPPARRTTSMVSMDAIANEESPGDDGEEGAEDATDTDEVYCICRRHSYGEMVGCDGPGCQFGGWFHMSCVGVKPPLPDIWYCKDCLEKTNFAEESTTKMRSNERGGRKRRK